MFFPAEIEAETMDSLYCFVHRCPRTSTAGITYSEEQLMFNLVTHRASRLLKIFEDLGGPLHMGPVIELGSRRICLFIWEISARRPG